MRTSFGKRPSGLRLERMQSSPLWSNGTFENRHAILPQLLVPAARPTLGEFVRSGGRKVPKGQFPAVDPRPLWNGRPETGLRATWLGHSTVLLEMDGVRVLTDPVWGKRASPTVLAGPKRFQPVPVPVSALPPLDCVLISHDHYDHLDYPTILELRHLKVPFVTSLGVGAHLESWGVPSTSIFELDWWESIALPNRGLTLTAVPSQHFSGRTLGGKNTTLWSSFVLQSEKHKVFFSGDTGLTTEYQDIAKKYGPFDLVMLEVGAFHPSWATIHLGPDNALEALRLLGGGKFLPVHWGTFSLAVHAWDDPVETLVRLAPKKGAHLVLPRLGQPIEPSRTSSRIVDPWWRPIAALDPRETSLPPAEEMEVAAPDASAVPVVGEPLDFPLD